MIKSDAELQQAIEQMGRLYRALASIRADVKEANPRLYTVMAEGPMDELARFQREVEEYVGLRDLRDEQADVWLRIHGPEVT
jgi:hypothetical protein